MRSTQKLVNLYTEKYGTMENIVSLIHFTLCYCLYVDDFEKISTWKVSLKYRNWKLLPNAITNCCQISQREIITCTFFQIKLKMCNLLHLFIMFYGSVCISYPHLVWFLVQFGLICINFFLQWPIKFPIHS